MKIFLLSLISLLTLNTEGQRLNGTFRSRSEYIRFSNDTAFFQLLYGGGIHSIYKASGVYYVAKNHLVIKPHIDQPPERIVKKNRVSQDSFFIIGIVQDTSIKHLTLILYDKNKKVLLGQIIQAGRKIYLSGRNMSADSVRLLSGGCIPIGIKIDQQFDYEFFLQTGTPTEEYEEVLNTKNGGFKVSISENKITLYRPALYAGRRKEYRQTFISE